jgi:hypothetical protein
MLYLNRVGIYLFEYDLKVKEINNNKKLTEQFFCLPKRIKPKLVYTHI